MHRVQARRLRNSNGCAVSWRGTTKFTPRTCAITAITWPKPWMSNSNWRGGPVAGSRFRICRPSVPATGISKERYSIKLRTLLRSGIDVGFDCYPYTRGSTVLTQLLPQWALEGGIDGLLARLADRAERARIAAQTEEELTQGWTGILISSVESLSNHGLIGKSIAAIASDRAREPVETVLDLIQEERGRVNMLELNQSESNLRETLTHRLSCIISDGFYVKGRPHPRLYGTFPFLLGEISRERRWLTTAEAVYKVTDKPALRFGISKRGRLEKGYFADVVVFDPETVNSPSTYENPGLAPNGIRYVFRNGC